MSANRIYLDHNATTPIGAAARDAMIAAMDVLGNPSSVHAEGRAAKNIVETARAAVSAAFGADGHDVIFTASATEAAALALRGRDLHCAGVEHDAVQSWCAADLATDAQGQVSVTDPAQSTLQVANSETGIISTLPEGLALTDATQAFGKIPFGFGWSGAQMALISAHKLNGPKGVGALVVRRGTDIAAQITGGGQEMGRRAGTENIIGIAGFGAAAAAAAQALDLGDWDAIREIRDFIEDALIDALPGTQAVQIIGRGSDRLPNTINLIAPGWRGETQVMAMDLAGFAISAGSACSSGKVRASKVLRAMGYNDELAASAIRVSLGLTTTRKQAEAFVSAYVAARKRICARMATAGN